MTVYNFGFIESQNSYPENWLIISNLPDVSPEIGEKTRKKKICQNTQHKTNAASSMIRLHPCSALL